MLGTADNSQICPTNKDLCFSFHQISNTQYCDRQLAPVGYILKCEAVWTILNDMTHILYFKGENNL